MSRVTGLVDQFGGTATDVLEAVQQELKRTGITIDEDLTSFIRDQINEWIGLGTIADEVQRRMQMDERRATEWAITTGAIRNTGKELIVVGEEAEEAAQKIDLVGGALRQLENQRTFRIRAQITAIQDQLEAAEAAAERARASLTAFITGRYANTAQAQVDALIGNIGSIGSAIEKALAQGGVRGGAALRSAVGGFESQIASIIQAGFDQGLRTQDEFRQLLAPLFATVDEEAGDAAGRILSTVDFTAGVGPKAGREIAAALNRVLEGNNLEVAAEAIMNTESEVERLQRQLDAAQASLEVDVAFSGDQVRSALEAAFDEAGITGQLRATLLGEASNQAVSDAQQSPLVQLAQQALNQAQQPTPFSPSAVQAAASQITIKDGSVTNINLTGSTDTRATAIEVVRQQQVAKTGRYSGYPVPVR